MGDSVLKQRAMVSFLLDELQPKMKSKKKDALDTFDTYYFKSKPQLSAEDISLLLLGKNGKSGLLAATGGTSWKLTGLTQASGKALQLMISMSDFKTNPHGAKTFLTVLKGLTTEQVQTMALKKHLDTARGNTHAARQMQVLLDTPLETLLAAEEGQQAAEGQGGGLTVPPSHEKKKSAIDWTPPPMSTGALSNLKPSSKGLGNDQNNFFSKLASFFGGGRESKQNLVKKGVLKEPKVFGCTLGQLHSNGQIDTATGAPTFLVEAFALMLEKKHTSLTGLFRVSGDSVLMRNIQKAMDFENGYDLNTVQDGHCIAGLVKRFFREMPEPLLTYDLYSKILAAYEHESQTDMDNLIGKLPSREATTFNVLMDFLAKVVAKADENKMKPKNLAIVFAPNLLRPQVETLETMTVDTPLTIGALQMLIEAYIEKHPVVEEATEETKQQPETTTTTTTEGVLPPPPTVVPADWVSHKDVTTGKVYFENRATGDTQWTKPVGFDTSSPPVLTSAPVVVVPTPVAEELPPVPITELPPAPATEPAPPQGEGDGSDSSDGEELESLLLAARQEREAYEDSIGKQPVDVAPAEVADEKVVAGGDDADEDAKNAEADAVMSMLEEEAEAKAAVASIPALPEFVPVPVPVAPEPVDLPPPVVETPPPVEPVDPPPVAEPVEAAPEVPIPELPADPAPVPIPELPAEPAPVPQLPDVPAPEPEPEPEPEVEPEPEPEPPVAIVAVEGPTAGPQTETPPPEAVLVPASNHTVDAKDTRPYAEWESVLDAASGNVYYYSPLTRTTTWDKPVGYRDELIVTRGTSAEREGWKTVSVSGSWSKADGTAGGCYPNCRTWRNNPQIMFSLAKTNRSCDALVQIEWIFGPNDPAPVVSATGKKKKRKHPPIGVYVVKNEGPFFQKLFVDKTDIAARSNFKKSGAVSCELNISTPASKGKLLLYYMRADSKTKQGLSFPKHFTIIPCTFNEGVEGKFKITLHTKNESYMRMLTDQHRLLDIPQRTRAYQSQWLGPSAGGCRNHATFTNNTRFELNTNTNGTFVGLLQQSSSSEMLTIGMYVMDREGTVVRKAAFMQAPEASCVFDYDATKAPFYLVPCTFDPGFEAEFTLTLIWKDPQLDVTFNPCV